jgi:hypothetical protein
MRLHQDPVIERTARFALLVLLYLEETGLVPQRFTPARLAAWHGMLPHLRELDLLELAVRDGVRANPHLFAAFRNVISRNELRALNEHLWHQELQSLQSLNLGKVPIRQLYLHGAETLGVHLPTIDEANLLGHPFDRSSLVAEVPNGYGYPSLLLCQFYDFLDGTHNVRIFTDGTEVEMLAAWAMVLLTGQLAPPLDRIIPVSATDHAALNDETFDAVLVYQPVPWLSSPLGEKLLARKFIHL